jgi:hypothetical protein
MSEAEHPGMPESNADAVAKQLVFTTIDFDGQGLVAAMRLLLSRAEELQALHQRTAAFDDRLLSGQVSDQMDANAELLDALYDTSCLKWFLSRAMKELAEHLGFDVYQKQQHVLAIEQITYTDQGGVESYRLAPRQTRRSFGGE